MPETRQACTPYLCCRGAARALEFYEKAFGAEVRQRYVGQDGRIGHAEIDVEGAGIFLADEWPEESVFSPEKYGGSPVAVMLVVKDVDAFVQRAGAAGARIERPPRNEPHGDRAATLRDPFGHRWFVATPIENVTTEEVQKRIGESFRIE
jgi:PhnB protein